MIHNPAQDTVAVKTRNMHSQTLDKHSKENGRVNPIVRHQKQDNKGSH